MISLVKKDYDSTKIYRKTHKKGASQTYDTPSLIKLVQSIQENKCSPIFRVFIWMNFLYNLLLCTALL